MVSMPRNPTLLAPKELQREKSGPAVSLEVVRAQVVPSPRRVRSRLAQNLLKQKSATLFRHYAAALTADEEGIHQARVWSRRLRVAVRLLAAKPEGRRATRAQRLLASLTQAAGRARDLDVLFETFDRRLQQLPERTLEQRRLRRRLMAARRRGRTRMTGCLLDLQIARLRADLAGLAGRACCHLPDIYQRFRELCGRESRKLFEGFATVGATLDVVALHALRRRARRWRYAVEVIEQLFGAEPGATKPWKALQDHLGGLHDHHVLAAWFMQQAAADEGRGEPALAAAARSEAEWARQAVHRLHDELLAADPPALVARGLAAVGLTPDPPAK